MTLKIQKEKSGIMNWMVLIQIFAINLVYIMISTIRILLMMKGYRVVAPILSVIEIIIYTTGLSIVMSYISQPIYLIVYALGFGIGIYFGILLEDYLALGYSVIQVFSNTSETNLAQQLRQFGYGVTEQEAKGRDGKRQILTILTPRKNEQGLCKIISELDEKAFYISYSAKYVNGGFWSRSINTQLIYQSESMLTKEELSDSNE